MKLVEQHIIRKTNINYKTIEDLSIKSNNLYNTALFIIRQHYFNRKGKQFISDICDNVDYDYINYYDMNRILKQIYLYVFYISEYLFCFHILCFSFYSLI